MGTGPVYESDFPDPFVLTVDGGYYAYGTNIPGQANVQLLFSPDLLTWIYLGDALPALPTWAEANNTWSPSVLRAPGGYVLYYAVREPQSGLQAISWAVADQPNGPFVDTTSSPLVFQQDLGGSIDPSPFVDADGRAYLLWKADSNSPRVALPTTLWAQELGDDRTSLVGEPTRLLTFDRRWERPLIESPSALRSDSGRYLLFYSANWWETERYAIGYAVADALLGPYRKMTKARAWFASDADVAGPGGQELFVDANGYVQMAFHGWQPGAVGYPQGVRSLRIVRVFVDGNSRPTVAPKQDLSS